MFACTTELPICHFPAASRIAIGRQWPNERKMRASNLQEDLAIEAAKAGDEIAFESLYRRYRRSVYVWCLRMTGDVPDAEDLTQEVFLQVYRKVASFRGEAAFGTWLYKVAMNVTRMQFRKRRIETTSLNYLLELDECTGGLE